MYIDVHCLPDRVQPDRDERILQGEPANLYSLANDPYYSKILQGSLCVCDVRVTVNIVRPIKIKMYNDSSVSVRLSMWMSVFCLFFHIP